MPNTLGPTCSPPPISQALYLAANAASPTRMENRRYYSLGAVAMRFGERTSPGLTKAEPWPVLLAQLLGITANNRQPMLALPMDWNPMKLNTPTVAVRALRLRMSAKKYSFHDGKKEITPAPNRSRPGEWQQDLQER